MVSSSRSALLLRANRRRSARLIGRPACGGRLRGGAAGGGWRSGCGPAGGPDGGLQRPLLGWISSGEQRRRRLRGVAAEATWREHPPAALERRPRWEVLAAAAPAACVKGGRRLRCGVPGRLPPPPLRTQDPMTTQLMKSRVAREQGRRVVGEAPTPR